MDFLEQVTKAGLSLLAIAAIFVVCAALIMCLLFRVEIKGLLNRLPSGRDNRPSDPGVQRDDGGFERTKAENALAVTSLPDDPSLRSWESKIESDLDKLPSSEHLARLKRALALVQRVALFENTCRNIYGTQIFALSAMKNEYGIDDEGLRAIFREHQARLKAREDTAMLETDFLRWLSFLTEKSLIHVKAGKYYLTDSGIQFLEYARTEGVNESKAF